MSTINSVLMSNSLPLSPATDGEAKSSLASPQDAARAAQDFEGVFASLMLKEMRKTLEPGTMFGEDSGDVYGGLFDLYLGQQMTQSGGFGLARMIRESLERSQSASHQKSTGAVRTDAANATKSLSENSPLAPALRGEGPGVRGSWIGSKR